MDKVLAKEMNSLRLQERNRVYDEIHGVAEPIEESPSMVAQHLSDLELYISRIRKRSAYEKAKFMCAKYVNDTNFRLLFLRAAEFDPRAAAKKLVSHFEFKLQLFGLDKLVRDIVHADLNEDDNECLECGCAQIIPAKDRNGRPIQINSQKFDRYKTWYNLVRTGEVSSVLRQTSYLH
jgi:hypothetical protein